MNNFSRAACRSGGVNVQDFGAVGDGIADDTRAIQNALDRGGQKIVIPHGLYTISSALRPHSGQELKLVGTLRMAAAVIQPLAADVAVGDTSVLVMQGAAYRVGQWVAVADDDCPRQRGGMQVRKQGAACAPITHIEGDRLHFATPFTKAYRRAARARAGTQSSVILVEDRTDVTLCGPGTIDGNKAEQFDVAPQRMDGTLEEVRAGCCIAASAAPGALRRIVVRGLNLQNAILHNLSLYGASHSRVLDTTCHAAHDKNIILLQSSDCLVRGNICTDSEFEDGIIFHQKTGCRRIMVQGNLCSGNARNGLHVGALERGIHLSGNLCINNGINLFIAGIEGSSTGDVSMGQNDRLLASSNGVLLAGQGNRVTNLTARGHSLLNVRIRARDLALIGGSVGGDEESSAAGIELSEPGSYTSAVLPERVLVQGLLISRCQTGLHVACTPRKVRVLQNTFEETETPVAAETPEGLAALHCADNESCDVPEGRGMIE